MAPLVKLPGIGRKTANVVLGHAFDVNEGIAVDTHVLRVANRLGLVEGDDPLKVEAQLMALVPRARWTRTTDLIIFHGRKVCDARRPACGTCTLFALCAWESRQAWASTDPPKAARSRRSSPAKSGPPPPRDGEGGPEQEMTRVIAAVVQMTSTADVDRNLGAAEELVERAADRGATFVALPENFAFLRSEGEPVPAPQALDGPWVERMADAGAAARAHAAPRQHPGAHRG